MLRLALILIAFSPAAWIIVTTAVLALLIDRRLLIVPILLAMVWAGRWIGSYYEPPESFEDWSDRQW
jgi:hypothetical protein